MNDIFRSRLEILVGEYFLYQEIVTPTEMEEMVEELNGLNKVNNQKNMNHSGNEATCEGIHKNAKGCKHLIDSFINNLDQMVLDQQDSCQEIVEALTTLSID